MNRTKSDLVSRVSQELNMSKTKTAEMVDVVLDSIVAMVKYCQPLQIRGFGTFECKKIKPRVVNLYANVEGQEPKMSKEITTLKFKPSKKLRNKFQPCSEKWK